MRGSVLLIGVLLAAITSVATDAFAQEGEVTDANIHCARPGYDVPWWGIWWDVEDEVLGVCQPDYGFGSVEVVTDKVEPASSPGSASVHLAQTYYFEGEYHDLEDVHVRFEFGSWYEGVWYCDAFTDWYRVGAIPTCFAAGTPLLTRDGSKPIEQLKAGDCILSSPWNDPKASPVASRVMGVIPGRAQTVDVTVGGHMVRATREHPFYVKGKAWTPAASLAVGDLLRSHDDRWVSVESIVDGKECPVYSLRVEGNSTYFVGGDDWGFSLWVRATCSKSQAPPEGLVQAKPLRWHLRSHKSHSRR